MYDIFETIESLTAIKAILHMGFIPRQENLEEFSAEDYIRANGDLDLDVDKHEKWFKINPPGRFMENGIYEESDLPTAVREHEIMVVNEEQCAKLWEAVAFIDQVCARANVSIDTDAEKIRYIEKVIPGC